MADRFPSLDDFDAGQTQVSSPPPATSTSASTSDFLARERAALGDDAQLFASSTDNAPTVADAPDSDDDDDDLLGGGGGGGGAGSQPTGMNGDHDDMMGDFETSYPTIDTRNEGVSAGGGTITGSTIPYRAPSASAYVQDEEEPEVVKEWRERRNLALESLDSRSASKKSETVKAAQEAIDEFYENYNNRKDKQVAQTRKEAEEYLKNREDTTSGGTSWERIAKLVDLSGKGAGGGASGTSKSKMREVLLDLRKDGNAPGATGV